MRRRLQQAALFAGSLALFTGIAEGLLRLALPEGYYVWPPHFREIFQAEPGGMPGIDGPSRLTINALGIRGDPFRPAQRYRLLAVGGSTTICAYLDDAEAWPHLVQRRLEEEVGEGAIWVGNVGRPGHATAQHRLQVEKLLAQHPGIDAVLLLVGINDLLVRLSMLRDPVPVPAPSSHAALRSAFSLFPGWDEGAPWYRRTGIARWLASRSFGLPGRRQEGPLVDQRGEFVARARQYRRQATSFLETLPDLDAGLAAYEHGLNAIIDAAQAAGRRPILLTQPTLWREGLTAQEEGRLWMGGPRLDRMAPGAEFYSVRALAHGMARYNQTLLRVCRERGVECIDVASRLPRDGTVFWDDAHFTEEGSRQLARLVADHLLATEPISGLGRRR